MRKDGSERWATFAPRQLHFLDGRYLPLSKAAIFFCAAATKPPKCTDWSKKVSYSCLLGSKREILIYIATHICQIMSIKKLSIRQQGILVYPRMCAVSAGFLLTDRTP